MITKYTNLNKIVFQLFFYFFILLKNFLRDLYMSFSVFCFLIHKNGGTPQLLLC